MFERIAIQYLRQWAKKEDRKPLVLRGARQVGKTTLVKLFAKEFDTYIYMNGGKGICRTICCRLFFRRFIGWNISQGQQTIRFRKTYLDLY